VVLVVVVAVVVVIITVVFDVINVKVKAAVIAAINIRPINAVKIQQDHTGQPHILL